MTRAVRTSRVSGHVRNSGRVAGNGVSLGRVTRLGRCRTVVVVEALGQGRGAGVGGGQDVAIIADDTALDGLLVAVGHAEEVVVNGNARSATVLRGRAGSKLSRVLKDECAIGQILIEQQ